MIILLQSAKIQFRRLFDIFCITKCRKVILLQSVTDCNYKVHQVLQSVTDFISKCVRYYKAGRNTCLKPHSENKAFS